MAEYASDADPLRYDHRVQAFGDLGASHKWLLSMVPAGSVVLDCGCAGGFLAAALLRKDCVVDGVEFEAEAAARARLVCRRVYQMSLELPGFAAALDDQYDRIIFGDVLEHLRDPEAVLAATAAHLAPGGRVLVSIPNVAHWQVRKSLLLGRFDYAEFGLLDRTHLRFFTYEGARRMAATAGFRIVRQEATLLPSPLPVGKTVINRIRRWLPNLFAYQTLLELQPQGSDGLR